MEPLAIGSATRSRRSTAASIGTAQDCGTGSNSLANAPHTTAEGFQCDETTEKVTETDRHDLLRERKGDLKDCEERETKD